MEGFAEYDRDGPSVFRGYGIVRAVSRRHALDKTERLMIAAHPDGCAWGAAVLDPPNVRSYTAWAWERAGRGPFTVSSTGV
jgi:hypothetical protein